MVTVITFQFFSFFLIPLVFFFLIIILFVDAAPSPRQRCRIKTNPWLSTPETAVGNSNSIMKKMDIDTSSTSSGIKSSSDAGTDDKKR